MLDLSPTKLVIIFVVLVVLLGPKRLPGVARQLGAGWRKLREFHSQVDRELRQSIPDLPSSQDIVRFARSPITLLNQLADGPDGGSPSAETSASPDGSELSDELEPFGTSASPELSESSDSWDSSDSSESPAPHGRTAGPGADGASANGHGRAAPALAALHADDPNLN